MPRIMNTRSIVLVALVAAIGCGGKQASTRAAGATAVAPAAAPAETAEASAPSQEALPNAKMVGEVLTGGQPSPGQYDAMAKNGYKTVLSLRTPEEPGAEASAIGVKALGMTYLNVPIAGAAGLTRENVQKFSDALARAEGPVVVHCASGNRVGAMFGLKAHWIDGASAEEALAIAKAAGVTGLEEELRRLLGLGN